MESGLTRLVKARGVLHSWISTLRILAWGLCLVGACPHAYPETSKHLPVGLSKYLLPTDQNGPLLLTPHIGPKWEADSALPDQGLQAKIGGKRLPPGDRAKEVPAGFFPARAPGWGAVQTEPGGREELGFPTFTVSFLLSLSWLPIHRMVSPCKAWVMAGNDSCTFSFLHTWPLGHLGEGRCRVMRP